MTAWKPFRSVDDGAPRRLMDAASPPLSLPLRGVRALVTGAGGFIASHLVERLVREGAQVTAFVRYNSRRDPGLLHLLSPDEGNRIRLVFGDLRDAAAVHQAMESQDLVFHLGSLIAIPYSYLLPREVVDTNITGTLNVLMSARALGTPRLIHTSTSEVYGSAQRLPMDESHPFQCQSPYAASKAAADHLVDSFGKSYGLPVVTVRPFNTYGPRQSTRAVIPAIITQALRHPEVALGDSRPWRDFTYVADTVDGFIRAAATEGVLGECFNLGSGQSLTIGDLAELIFRLLGVRPSLRTDPARLRPPASEVLHLEADAGKARHRLGWNPRTPLEDGLKATIEWLRAHPPSRNPAEHTL